MHEAGVGRDPVARRLTGRAEVSTDRALAETSIERQSFFPAAAQRREPRDRRGDGEHHDGRGQSAPIPDKADGDAGRQRRDSGERPVARASVVLVRPRNRSGVSVCQRSCSGVFSMPIAAPCTPIATNRRAAPSSDGGATATRIHASG